MQYRSVNEIAKKWNMSERSVRNYCAQGRVDGVFLTGKTWNIPENAEKPERSNKKKEQPITLVKACPMPVASAAPSIPISGNRPQPKIRTGSKTMFVIHPHIKLIMVVFMFPTAWNSFSNVTPTMIINVKSNAITE